MGQFLDVSDLAPFADIDPAKADVMIEDAEALAVLAAPCLSFDQDPPLNLSQIAAVKALLRGAILRWNDAGSGVISSTTQQAGPFSNTESLDTRQSRKSMFWPSEITSLQAICNDGSGGGAFSVDTAPGCGGLHEPWCSVSFGATYCSCGVDIAGYPIFEL